MITSIQVLRPEQDDGMLIRVLVVRKEAVRRKEQIWAIEDPEPIEIDGLFEYVHRQSIELVTAEVLEMFKQGLGK